METILFITKNDFESAVATLRKKSTRFVKNATSFATNTKTMFEFKFSDKDLTISFDKKYKNKIYKVLEYSSFCEL